MITDLRCDEFLSVRETKNSLKYYVQKIKKISLNAHNKYTHN